MFQKVLRWTLIAALAACVATVHAAAPSEGDSLPVAFDDRSVDVVGFVHGGGFTDSVSGVAWLDYDNDGWLDFYVANSTGFADGLMRNNGADENGVVTFTNQIAAAGIADMNGSSGVAAADLDNDGDTDLVVTGESAFFVGLVPSARMIRLYSNNGDGTFSDVTAASGVSIASAVGAAGQPVLGDINDDGLVDLFVTAPWSLSNFGANAPSNHLFLNQGGLVFSDISAGSGVGYAGANCAASFSDYDRDGLVDLYLADCNIADPPLQPGFPPTLIATPLRLYRNNGDLTFSRLDVGLPSPEVVGQPFPPVDRGFWMCVGLADIDNDEDFDLFSTNLGEFFEVPPLFGAPQDHGLFEHGDDGRYTAIEASAGLVDQAPEFSWGCSFADFNNDGWDDLAVAGNVPLFGVVENPGYLLVNQGDKTFREEGFGTNLAGKYSSGVASADYDNDGAVDLLVSNGSTPFDPAAGPTLLNNRGNDNGWITVRLEGTASNRDAVGARVRVEVENRVLTKEVRAGSSFLSQDSPWLTFGLNRQRRARSIEVTWPSGAVETYTNVDGQRTVVIVEGTGIVD